MPNKLLLKRPGWKQNETVHNWLSPRMLFAFALALVGALIAGQMAGYAERIVVVFVSMLIAVFVVADPDSDDEFRAEANNPVESGSAVTISSHPQLQAFIDASADAVMMVENARVTAANQAARQLLGTNIVGKMSAWRFVMQAPLNACPIPIFSTAGIRFV